MYRHLLVPLDDSPLSVETVRQAVEFARTVKAKVTFLHAQEDYGATSVGALERVMSPQAFNEHMAGEARALLSKAEVVARTAGVEYESIAVTSNRPYESILGAAQARGCDLIFIASHGRRGIKGLMLGSQTQKVLQHTTIPVLVSAVESNLPAAELNVPLNIISDEHRSLAAVIHGLEHVVRETRESRTPPSFALLHAMLHYIREFPEKLHHPKEDAYLFRKLRERTSEVNETLSDLEWQHVAGHRLVEEHRRVRSRSGAWLRGIREGGRRVRDESDAAHGVGIQGGHSRGAEALDAEGLGRDRRRVRRERRSALLRGHRRGIPAALRPDPQSRSGTRRGDGRAGTRARIADRLNATGF